MDNSLAASGTVIITGACITRVASCAETGDMLDGLLRPGNVHTAEGALGFILGLVDRCKATLCRSAIVRIDAGFPDNDTLSGLESRKVPYVARIRNNQVLGRLAEPYLKRPPGRPPQTPGMVLRGKLSGGPGKSHAGVVLVVVERPGDLFLDHFWLITSLDEKRYPADKLLTLYRKRGKAEAHMGELMDVLDPALSVGAPIEERRPGGTGIDGHGRAPQQRDPFLLNLLAYEILHMGRTLMEKATREGWSLRRFRERILRVASRGDLSWAATHLRHAQSAADDWQEAVAQTQPPPMGVRIERYRQVVPYYGETPVVRCASMLSKKAYWRDGCLFHRQATGNDWSRWTIR